MRLTVILNKTVNQEVDVMMMKLSELFLKVGTIQ